MIVIDYIKWKDGEFSIGELDPKITLRIGPLFLGIDIASGPVISIYLSVSITSLREVNLIVNRPDLKKIDQTVLRLEILK